MTEVEGSRKLANLCTSEGGAGRPPGEERPPDGGLSPGDLAAWLHAAVGNPAGERYLLDLYFGEGGVAAGNPSARRRFCRELELRRRPSLRRAVLGWGEISQVAEIEGLRLTSWRNPRSGGPMPVVYKKMPPFLKREDAEVFVARYTEYNAVLCDEAGIRVPAFSARIVGREPDPAIVFVIQERVDPAAVGHNILKTAGPAAAERLCALVLREYEKLYRLNRGREAAGYRIGLDGQIPNWAVAGYGGDPDALGLSDELIYLDTNVPMIRIGGRDVVSTDMYFQALPGLARWIIKRLNLDQEVMDRYFEVRVILLDFLGNLIVRHRADLVPRVMEMANEALAGPFAAEGWAPFTPAEVEKYYRSDVSTWRLWRSLKLLGALSDGISAGRWGVLRRLPEFYRIWTRPIF